MMALKVSYEGTLQMLMVLMKYILYLQCTSVCAEGSILVQLINSIVF